MRGVPAVSGSVRRAPVFGFASRQGTRLARAQVQSQRPTASVPAHVGWAEVPRQRYGSSLGEQAAVAGACFFCLFPPGRAGCAARDLNSAHSNATQQQVCKGSAVSARKVTEAGQEFVCQPVVGLAGCTAVSCERLQVSCSMPCGDKCVGQQECVSASACLWDGGVDATPHHDHLLEPA
jgi:hypothetical protein